MKILITGICGFVGSTLARHLAEQPWVSEIVGIDNFSRAGSERNRLPLRELGIATIPGDIRSASDVEGLPASDWVIDAAANPSVLAGVDGKTSSRQLIEHNLAGTINLLEYCKRHSAGFVLLSTSRVYSIPALAQLKMTVDDSAFQIDPDQTLPTGITTSGVNEDYSTMPPVSLYGSTKVASEHLALEYGGTFEFPVAINRCGVMAGAGQFGHPAQGIFAFWIHSFREGKPLKYIGFGGSGYQVRDCLHPQDLVPLIQQHVDNPQQATGKIFNVAGGVQNSMSLAQLTRWCRQRFPDSATSATLPEMGQAMPTAGSEPDRPFDIPHMVLDPSRIGQQLGWQPRTSIDQVLEEIASFAETQSDWLALSRG